MAFYELWREQGLEPRAIIGVCGGEITAGYATGALSFEDSAAVACSVAHLVTQAPLRGHSFTLGLNFEKALLLSRRAPARLEIAMDLSPVSALAYCTSEDFAIMESFLEANAISYHASTADWPYHTSHGAVALQDETVHAAFAPVQMRPLTCPFYSCYVGHYLPSGTVLDAQHWYQASVSNVWFGRTIGMVLAYGYNTLLNISGFPTLNRKTRECAAAQAREILWLDCVDRQEPGRNTWAASHRALHQRGLVKKHPRKHASDCSARSVWLLRGVARTRLGAFSASP